MDFFRLLFFVVVLSVRIPQAIFHGQNNLLYVLLQLWMAFENVLSLEAENIKIHFTFELIYFIMCVNVRGCQNLREKKNQTENISPILKPFIRKTERYLCNQNTSYFDRTWQYKFIKCGDVLCTHLWYDKCVWNRWNINAWKRFISFLRRNFLCVTSGIKWCIQSELISYTIFAFIDNGDIVIVKWDSHKRIPYYIYKNEFKHVDDNWFDSRQFGYYFHLIANRFHSLTNEYHWSGNHYYQTSS